MKKIEIMGCGYIGLPTAVTFTLAGYEVCGFDVKAETVNILSQGKINIVEPGLQEALTEAMATGRLHFTTTPEPLCRVRGARGRQRHPPGRTLRAGIHLASRLDAARRADRLRGQRPEAGRVYDGALPRAHHSGADAP